MLAGADAELGAGSVGVLPLHLAVLAGDERTDVLSELLRSELNHCTIYTILYYSQPILYYTIVRTASVRTAMSMTTTAVTMAAAFAAERFLRLAGCRPSSYPLLLPATMAHLRLGARVDAPDDHGVTALHAAASLNLPRAPTDQSRQTTPRRTPPCAGEAPRHTIVLLQYSILYYTIPYYTILYYTNPCAREAPRQSDPGGMVGGRSQSGRMCTRRVPGSRGNSFYHTKLN